MGFDLESFGNKLEIISFHLFIYVHLPIGRNAKKPTGLPYILIIGVTPIYLVEILYVFFFFWPD